jgi:hypothetical protein
MPGLNRWCSGFLVWLAVFGAVWGFQSCSKAPTGSAQTAVATQEPAKAQARYDKLALLVGINNYKYVKPLGGTVNDVRSMRALLVERFGFPDDDEHIRVLTDEQATRDAILRAIKEHLISKAGRDTIVVFHYSGHGSYVRDANGDETDGYDETIVPYDSGRKSDPGRDITDDEINALLSQLTEKTANVTFIFDSCHSGTAIRGAGLARTIEPDDRPPANQTAQHPSAQKLDEGKNDLRPAGSRYALLSGCAADEVSYETQVDGQSHGALTWCLVDQIRKSGPGLTYRDVIDLVRLRVSAIYPSQHPQLEGPGEDQLVFNDKSLEPAAFVLVKPLSEGTVALEAGQVHGATRGSVYRIYPPGTKSFGKDVKAIAQAEITDVSATSSYARITKGNFVPSASRAVEIEHEWPDAAFRVFFKGLSGSETLRKAKAELQAFKHITPMGTETGYDILIREHRDENGRRYIVTEGGDPTEISPRVSVSGSNAVSQIVEQVAHWAKWFNVLRIANQNPDLKVEIELAPTRESHGQPGQGGRQTALSLLLGERFKVRVSNKSRKDLYIALLDLSDDGSVEPLYPTGGQREFVAPGRVWEKELEATLAEGRDTMRDILKLVATTRYVDYIFLRQSAVGAKSATRGQGSPLEELLANAAIGTARGGAKRVEVGDWTTADGAFEVHRK